MRARATRLEFIIVLIALFGLLMCSSPPKSGNASVSGQTEADDTPDSAQTVLDLDSVDEDRDMPSTSPVPEASSTDLAEEISVPQAAPRMAVVDARGSDQLGYNEVMYGKVTVRWVWNGTKLVPEKVCVVQEDDGVSSVWSFDRQKEAVLSELPQQSAPSR
jgi:hypothetical protein